MFQAIANMKSKGISVSIALSGSSVLVHNDSSVNTDGVRRLASNRVISISNRGSTAMKVCMVQESSGTLSQVGSALSLSGATNLDSYTRRMGLAVDLDYNIAMVAGSGRSSSGANDDTIVAWVVNDSSGPNELDALGYYNPTGDTNDVIRASECVFLSNDGTYSYFACIYLYLDNSDSSNLKLGATALRYNRGTTTIDARSTYTSTTLGASVASSELMKIGASTVASNVAMINLQGGNYYKLTYNVGSNFWSETTGSGFNNDGCVTAISRKESILNTFGVAVLAHDGGDGTSPNSHEIEFANESGVVGDNWVVGTNVTTDQADLIVFGSVCLGLLPDGTTKCIVGYYRENSSNDIVLYVREMTGDSTFGNASEINLSEVFGALDGEVAQLSNDYWVWMGRDEAFGDTYAYLISVTIN